MDLYREQGDGRASGIFIPGLPNRPVRDREALVTKIAHKRESDLERRSTFRKKLSMLAERTFLLILIAVVALTVCSTHSGAQAALLLEEPYGFFGIINPTGHAAIYFEQICAETPVKLRRCEPGEPGAVIARYQGIAGYDWVAIPLVPYLYSVHDPAEVPARVDRSIVANLRNKYHEEHLLSLGDRLPRGNLVRGGWAQLIGVAYERRVFAFRFDTTPEQDDALIAHLNGGKNRSHFHMLYNNCADFARGILNQYFPHTFRRSLLPDAGMTNPKQITFKLERYARKHPETRLMVFEIQQIPGYRRRSKANKNIAESLVTTGYAIPIAVMNPYLAGGLFVDFAMRGHFHLIPRNRRVLTPGNLSELTAPYPDGQNAESAGVQVPSAAASGFPESQAAQPADFGLREIKVPNE